MEYKTLTFSNMTTYTRDFDISTSSNLPQTVTEDLSEHVNLKPRSGDSIGEWESWLDQLRIEKVILEESFEVHGKDEEEFMQFFDSDMYALENVRHEIVEAERNIVGLAKLLAVDLSADLEEDVEERAKRMASETENIFLEGLPGAEQEQHPLEEDVAQPVNKIVAESVFDIFSKDLPVANKDPHDMLKPWVPSWYPNPDKDESGGMFLCETGREKWLGLIPDGVMPDSTHKSNFTYYPENSRFSSNKRWGRSLGPWGGGIQELPWWQGWNLVGHGVLIMVKRCHGTQIGNPNSDWIMPTHRQDGHHFYHGTKFYLECEEPETGAQAWTEQEYCLPELRCEKTAPDYCWMFALVDGWDGELQKHNLVFLDHGVFYTVSDVNLRNCVFQEWTRPNLRRFKGSPLGEEENYSMAYSGFGGPGVKQPGELWTSVPYTEYDLEEGEIRE